MRAAGKKRKQESLGPEFSRKDAKAQSKYRSKFAFLFSFECGLSFRNKANDSKRKFQPSLRLCVFAVNYSTPTKVPHQFTFVSLQLILFLL
jgi:hypothetical protein